MTALAPHDIHPIPQYAVDKYNIDLALPDNMLAIEVHGGNWHMTSAKKRAQDAEKFQVLRAHGWVILIVKTRRQCWLDLGVASIRQWLISHPKGQLQLFD
jgi:very-short-patch-repair endonuclease